MCLAIPPNSVRNQHYALPYSFQFGTAAPPASGGASNGACGYDASASSSSTSASSNSGGSSSSSSSPYDPFALPNTPPPSFSCALGPTGFSPVATWNHGQSQSAGAAAAAAAGSPMAAGASALPNIPSSPSSSSSSSVKPRRTKAKSSKATTAKRRRRGPQRPGKTATQKERLFVQHNYHDLSNEPDVPYDDIANEKTSLPLPSTATNGGNGGLSESFPMKMHRILEDSEAAGLGDIIAWQPHGRAFKIRDPHAFTEQIMTRYFPKMKKLTSLQRQFNLYGFERLTREGPDAGAYYHEAFLRHRPGLSVQRMFRKRIKGTGYKAASNPDAEPDLYALPSMDQVMSQRRNSGGSLGSVTQGLQAAAIAPVASSSSNNFYGAQGYYVSSNYDDNGMVSTSRNQEEVDGGIVTESTSSSYCSSSEDNQDYQQTQSHQAYVPAQVPSNLYMPQENNLCNNNITTSNNTMQQHQGNLTMMDPGRNHVMSPSNSIDATTMDKFLALPLATQDSYLQELFSTNDVTPMSPTMSPRQQQQQQSQQLQMSSNATSASQGRQSQQQQEDHPVLAEFADLWDVWENVTSAENASFHPTY